MSTTTLTTTTSITFIPTLRSDRGWELLKEVIGSISLWELWFFGGIKKEKEEPLSYTRYWYDENINQFSEVIELAPDSLCSTDWVDADMQSLEGALEDMSFYTVVRAVNAALMFRLCKGHGNILDEDFLADIKQGGYWDWSTPRQVRLMLDFWGHYNAPESLRGNEPWFSEEKLPEGYEGKQWFESDVLDMLWLPAHAPYESFLRAHATDSNDKEGLLLYDTLWVKYSEELVYFPGFTREGRFRYTWKGEGFKGGEHRYVMGDGHMLGNVLFWWCIGEPPLKHISALLNKDATNLVAPNRVYGHPSPLNKASDRCTVGHLTLSLEGGGKGCPFYLEVDNDNDAYAAAAAAKYAFAEGLPVLFQHQMESIRVGKAAAGLGKSTIIMVLPVQGSDGSIKIVKVRLSLGQIAVDKIAKLFNRDSLEFRCQPIVDAIRSTSDEQMKQEDSLVDMFDMLTSQALA